MQRRNFLYLAGLLLAGAMSRTNTMAAAPKKVIVIGAGMAGLAAAQELVKQGHEVLILEGRDRIDRARSFRRHRLPGPDGPKH